MSWKIRFNSQRPPKMGSPNWRAYTNINRKDLKRRINRENEFPIIINHRETTQLKILIYTIQTKQKKNKKKVK